MKTILDTKNFEKQLDILASKIKDEYYLWLLDFFKYLYQNDNRFIIFAIDDETLTIVILDKEDMYHNYTDNNKIIVQKGIRIVTKLVKNHTEDNYPLMKYNSIKNIHLSKEDDLCVIEGFAYASRTEYLFFDKYKIFQYNRKGTGKIWELTIRDLCKENLDRIFISIYLKTLAKDNISFNDIVNDYHDNPFSLCVPFKFSEFEDYHNKTQLLLNHYKNFEKLNVFNKIPLSISVLYHKYRKNFTISDLQILKKLNLINVYLETKRIDLIKEYYLQKFDVIDDKIIFNDYFDLVIKTRSKFNLNFPSFTTLKNNHDKLFIKYNAYLAKTRKLNIIKKDSIYNNLSLPDNFERIVTKQRLLLEGTYQHNCVASYCGKIQKDSCAIYSLIYKDKRYTVEIGFKTKGKRYYIKQIRAINNAMPDQEVINYVKECVKKEKIIKGDI